jgi:hypothetical protein
VILPVLVSVGNPGNTWIIPCLTMFVDGALPMFHWQNRKVTDSDQMLRGMGSGPSSWQPELLKVQDMGDLLKTFSPLFKIPCSFWLQLAQETQGLWSRMLWESLWWVLTHPDGPASCHKVHFSLVLPSSGVQQAMGSQDISFFLFWDKVCYVAQDGLKLMILLPSASWVLGIQVRTIRVFLDSLNHFFSPPWGQPRGCPRGNLTEWVFCVQYKFWWFKWKHLFL